MKNKIKSSFFLLFLLVAIFIFGINWMNNEPKLNVVSKSGEGLNSISESLFELFKEELIKHTNYIGGKKVFLEITSEGATNYIDIEEKKVLFKGAVNGYWVEMATEYESYYLKYSKENLNDYRPWTRIHFLVNQKNKSYRDSFSISGEEIGGYQVAKIANTVVFFIWIIGEGSGSYGDLYAIEYHDNKFRYYMVDHYHSLNEELKRSYMGHYMGHDSYEFKGDEIIRSFPIYKENDPNCCPTGGRAKIYYRYKDQKILQEKIEINQEN